jgi:hypothetical protein
MAVRSKKPSSPAPVPNHTGTERAPLSRWVSVEVGAEVLGMSAEALRKKLERNARVAPDGVVEAEIDGVRARKFGRLWRLTFSARWVLVP